MGITFEFFGVLKAQDLEIWDIEQLGACGFCFFWLARNEGMEPYRNDDGMDPLYYTTESRLYSGYTGILQVI